MKLVLQHPHRREEISGVVTSIEEMLPELASRKGVEVRVLSTKDNGVWQQIGAVWWADAIMLNSNCLAMTIVARLLRRRTLLKLHYVQYHSVHVNYAPMSFHRRIVAELRHFRGLKSGPLYLAESVGRLVLRTVSALLVHRVCACSSFGAEQASLPRDVRVLRNPMRIPAGQRQRDFASLERPRRFVFIGRVTHDKGYDTVVDAAREIANSGRDFRIDVIGDGPHLAEMKKQVAEHGLTAQFRFFGRLDSIHALATMSGALAAIMPSRSQETAGYIPVEAASRRVMSIVSTVGGLAETAGPDCPTFTAGRADELAQLMIRYLDDPGKALAAGYSAYRRAQERYSPRLIVDELLALLAAKKSPQKDPDVRGDLNAAQRDAQPEHR
jgi:glycogen(starch) synthase